jgi:hypothetical protein
MTILIRHFRNLLAGSATSMSATEFSAFGL